MNDIDWKDVEVVPIDIADGEDVAAAVSLTATQGKRVMHFPSYFIIYSKL